MHGCQQLQPGLQAQNWNLQAAKFAACCVLLEALLYRTVALLHHACIFGEE
jgi:hypothetical protein